MKLDDEPPARAVICDTAFLSTLLAFTGTPSAFAHDSRADKMLSAVFMVIYGDLYRDLRRFGDDLVMHDEDDRISQVLDELRLVRRAGPDGHPAPFGPSA